ncbi:serine hydrolase domain-containing protein [Pelagibacterium halotolerans]|uniref:Beta-lactamase class C-like penicillin binding protein n=1 Tax=Pelagibacterium halotolerans (strain DSM 22347 / JCM 15775 / CGMCC 1.7692 / B2) TaxID=1082931 RepID=G4RAI3_PELHB|nr:serine hydrolase [Pelagibacterium halotolerans]AEQ51533.1 beta-lactamase class C-like penicillin binding protein [Pelagibacterium halotolerans B2]QJR18633.1 serine hydrolase [Pelagibacterium halotolerans]SEA16179.1 CubicO group peptidase, beta-lactamase class C family [Pelagibacterium halotolerans]
MTISTFLRPARALTMAAAISFPLAAWAQETTSPDPLTTVLDAAERLEPLRTVTISLDGEIIADRGYNGYTSSDPTNIKSASKVIVTTMIGIAIDRGLLEGPDQPVAELLADDLPSDPDPRLDEITLSHLMSMQAGLEATSGANYGRWVASSNWVRSALAQPMVAEPGGPMIYSTGSTHLLSAILTEVGGASTRQLARDWLGPIDGFAITGWHQDPQGVYLGGNELAMTPLSLLAFGEMIRNGGVVDDGERIVSEGWIDQSWQQRTTSRFGGHGYGYGWFLAELGGHDVSYAWGYGGQMLYIVPDLDLTVVMTSDPNSPSGGNGHRDRLQDLLADIIGIYGAGSQE